MAKDSGIYHGRLVADGNGNLLADEAQKVGEKTITVTDSDGEDMLNGDGQPITVTVPIFKFGKNHGKPVAFHEGSYVFVQKGEPSHNERHHQQVAQMTPTQHMDNGFPGYAGDPDNPTEGNEHHWGPTPDDPHYSEGATDADGVTTNTKLIQVPDSLNEDAVGHTAAYVGDAATGGDDGE